MFNVNFSRLALIVSFLLAVLTGCTPSGECRKVVLPDGTPVSQCPEDSDDSDVQPDDSDQDTDQIDESDPFFFPFRDGDFGRRLDWEKVDAVPGDWNVTGVDYVDIDEIHIVQTTNVDPLVEFRSPGWPAEACNPSGQPQGSWRIKANLPELEDYSNGIAVFVQPDGRVVEVSYFYGGGCEGADGTPYVNGWVLPDAAAFEKPLITDADAFSWWGGHGGSHISALGGVIRQGELTDADGAINHVLNIEVDKLHLWFSGEAGEMGFRWPAHSADSYAPNQYWGSIPELAMGSLLAVPPAFTCSELLTEPARRICVAMQVYGALVVDDPWGEHEVAFPMEVGVRKDVQTKFGLDMANAHAGTGAAADYAADIRAIMAAVVVVDNPDGTGVWVP